MVYPHTTYYYISVLIYIINNRVSEKCFMFVERTANFFLEDKAQNAGSSPARLT